MHYFVARLFAADEMQDEKPNSALENVDLLLWIIYVFVLPCVCYVFVHICLYVLCGHLLGKG